MSKDKPVTVICRYQIKPGKEAEMEKLLARHWTTLHKAGLVTDEKAVIYKAKPSEKAGDRHGWPNTYVEIFSWKAENSSAIAHETPAIMAVWEPMGAICESMQFPHFDRLNLL